MVEGDAAGQQLEAVLDVYDGVGFVVDGDGYFREARPGADDEDLLYVPPGEIEGRHIDDIFPEDDARRFLDTIETTLAQGSTQQLVYELDVAAGHRWFEAKVTPLDESDGTVLWLARDVTEEKNRQDRLEATNAKIAALHDVATDIETCERPDAVYERVVEAAETILEFDIAIADAAEDGVLVPVAVSSAPSDDQYYEETPIDAEDNLAAEAYRTGESSLVDDLRTHDVAPADPDFRSALTVPIGDHGIFQSVTERPGGFDETDLELVEMLCSHARGRLTQLAREQQLKDKADELQRQNERLDEFASIVSHDLRTPLTVARGNLRLAQDEVSSEYLQQVEEALTRMERLIENLLTMAREGSRVGEIEPVDLAEAAESCWPAVAPDPATLRVETDLTIRADTERLQQLLENLLSNAIEHGGETVTVTVGDLPDGFYVADDGPGIPATQRGQVFESGFSTDSDGTGFGLTIVREIVEAHGWSIEVTESESGGARFEITGVEAATR